LESATVKTWGYPQQDVNRSYLHDSNFACTQKNVGGLVCCKPNIRIVDWRVCIGEIVHDVLEKHGAFNSRPRLIAVDPITFKGLMVKVVPKFQNLEEVAA
jgi:hypothetical protein